MKINFHGAAQTVTGSQHLLEINGFRLLLDCGLYQGRRADTYERNLNFKFDPRKIDAVILSHAHIDHVGNLPNLVRQGYEGPVYATKASADLAKLMTADSGRIQENDSEYINKRRAQKGEPLIEPLYTQADAEETAQYFKGIAYGESFEPIKGVVARFQEAGHILGSASVALDIEEKSKKIRFWFSGDIGRYRMPILRDPVLPDQADILLMESTYGDKSHNDPEQAFLEFRDVAKRTLERGGKLIIPAFAVGRTQEIVLYLNQLMTTHEIPSVPVYVDSPLAVKATGIFKAHPECFDEETNRFVQEARHPALDFKNLTYVQSVDESKALNECKDSMVIISASGMAETGRVVHHIRNNIENPKNTICIVSWQAPETLGRRLADRETQVRIFGETYKRKCDVATIGGLSGHAGQNLLMEYALRLKGQARQTFLVHGEEKSALILMNKLQESGMDNVVYPSLHSSFEI